MKSLGSRLRLLVDKGLEIVTGVMLVGMMVDVIFGIADRFLFHTGAAWPEEVGRYLLIWVSFLAAAIVVKHEEHFAVMYFVDSWAREPLKRKLRLFSHALNFAVGVGLLVAGIPLIETGALQISPGSEIPMSWVFAAAPACGVLFMYYTILHVIRELRTGPKGESTTEESIVPTSASREHDALKAPQSSSHLST